MDNDIIQDDVQPASVPSYGILTPHRISCGHTMNGRNLIVCIDGTSNQFGAKNTNVIELYNLILKTAGDNQHTWYNSGIGTYARPSWKSLSYYKKVFYHKIDLAIAWGFERTILAAYRWLSDNYQDGDCIFLFGFSRGAYQVRVLSAMINKVGLIYKGNESQIPFAFELYVDPKSDEPEEVTQVGSDEKLSMAGRFKGAFSHSDVKVHFVGAWDTVSSIGTIRGKYMLPGTVDGMKHVCYFRHALALDERRVKFLPEYAYGGSTKPANIGKGKNQDRKSAEGESPDKSQPSGTKVTYSKSGTELVGEPQTLEIWFPGTHSDIGGGNAKNFSLDRSRPPLRWMVYQAGAVGLRTGLFKRNLTPEEQIHIQESLTWHWWLLEILPLRRLTFTRREEGKQTTYKPHFGGSRKIHPGQQIHGSFFMGDKPYTPKARPLTGGNAFWETLRSKKLHSNWVELELGEKTRLVVERLCAGDSDAKESLNKIATSSDGQQELYNKVVSALGSSEAEVKHVLLESAVDILTKNRGHTQLRLEPRSHIRPLVLDLWTNGNQNYQKATQEFIALLTDPCIFVLNGHDDVVYSSIFSTDGRRAASASFDQTIRVWDMETGSQVGEPFMGHTKGVSTVVFSPSGDHLISGSSDFTVRIWDAKTGAPVGDPLKHDNAVSCAVISSDRPRIASASYDKTIRIWDMETGKSLREPLQHSDDITWLACSPDGDYLAGCTSDSSVWIWDLRPECPVGRPSTGHGGSILSVAFSPNGKQVVSGSTDCTIRIWDVETGKQVGEPFPDDQPVNSAEFSFDNKFMVSSSGTTIRIWDLETREQVREPFRGHDGIIARVLFSPDGKRVISSSFDHTIRIWDVEILPPNK